MAASTYADGLFTVNESTDVAGLVVIKGGSLARTDAIVVVDPAVLTIESDIACSSIEGAILVATGVTVTAAARTPDLCTLEDVYPHAGVTDDDGGALAKLISAASRAIRKNTGLSFGPVVTEDRVVRVFGVATAYPRELCSLTVVKDADGHVVDAIVAETDDDGHVVWLDLPERMAGPLTISGTWGWDAVPEDVVLYAAQAVGDWFKRDQTISIDAMGNFAGDTTRRTRLLPPYVAEGLAQYRKRRF